MSDLQPFESAHLKIDHAKRHMHSLVVATGLFAAEHPAKVNWSTLPSGGPRIGIVTPTAPIPHNIALMVGDILHNLRSALDLMMGDIARLRGKPNVKFPFAATKDALEEILKKETIKIGVDIAEIVRSYQPFKGGNIALRALHDLDIIDKHKLLLPISRQNLYLMCSFTFRYLGTDGLYHTVSRPITAGQHDLEISGVPGTYVDYTVSLPPNYDLVAVTFGKSMPFAGKPVIETLEQLLELVSGIVETFQAHCLGS